MTLICAWIRTLEPMEMMPANLLIRPESAEDIDAIYALNAAAFGSESEARLVNLLRKSEAFIPGLSLVAELNSKIVGHILFTRIKIISDDQQEYPSLALAPMAVAPGFQQQGIGSQLVIQGLEQTKALGHASVIVLGHEKYYPRFGFIPTTHWNIRSPFDVPAAVFMGIELQPGALQSISGTVQYPREFEMI